MEQGIYIKFNPHTKEFLFWKLEDLISVKLNGFVNVDFENEKVCIGYNDGERMVPCRFREYGTKQCGYCAKRDISKAFVRLDFEGFEHIEKKMSERESSVYLAYFGGDFVKCGVTGTERIEKRMFEQGAMYYVEIMRFPSAFEAYDMEAMMQNFFGFKKIVRNETKIKLWSDIRIDVLKKAAEAVSSTEPFSSYVKSISVRKSNDPVKCEPTQDLCGKVVKNIGSILILEKGGRLLGYNMKKKLGHPFIGEF